MSRASTSPAPSTNRTSLPSALTTAVSSVPGAIRTAMEKALTLSPDHARDGAGAERGVYEGIPRGAASDGEEGAHAPYGRHRLVLITAARELRPRSAFRSGAIVAAGVEGRRLGPLEQKNLAREEAI